MKAHPRTLARSPAGPGAGPGSQLQQILGELDKAGAGTWKAVSAATPRGSDNSSVCRNKLSGHIGIAILVRGDVEWSRETPLPAPAGKPVNGRVLCTGVAGCDQRAYHPGDVPNGITKVTNEWTAGPDGSLTRGTTQTSKIDYLFASAGFGACDSLPDQADSADYGKAVQPGCLKLANGPKPVCVPNATSDHAPLLGSVNGGPRLDWPLRDTSGHSGTVSGGASWTTEHGGAAVLNGSTGEIVAGAPAVDTARSFTVSVRAKADADAGTSVALGRVRRQRHDALVQPARHNMAVRPAEGRRERLEHGPGSDDTQPVRMGDDKSASGRVAGSGTVSITTPKLTPGHKYGWCVRTVDGSSPPSPTAAVCHFTAAGPLP